MNPTSGNWRDTIDWPIIAITFLILGIGVLTVMSATYSPLQPEANLYKSQLLWVGIGLVALLLSMAINYNMFLYLAYPAYGLGIALLIFVLIQGKQTMGASRWIYLGGLHFQPSEFMKLVMVITLARYFHFDPPRPQYNLRELIVPSLLVLLPFYLIVKEPDLGTGLLLAMTAGAMFLFMNIRRKTLIIIGAIGLFSLPFVYNFGLKGYQKVRVQAFINPFSDPHGAGYNSIQSIIAVGSGQILGKGFKKGTQSQLDFIPEHHTDFAFSVFAEEQGFIGCMFLISLYCGLILLGLKAAARSRDRFGTFLGVGLSAHLLFQILVNMGMVTGILPVVGVALPFVSYGGSNMVFSLVTVGLLLNLSLRRYTF